MVVKANRSNTPSIRLTSLFLVVLLLFAFALRLYRVGDSSVWWDEGMSVWHARQSMADIAREISHNVHPPLYFWLLHGWRAGSGDSEFGLRMLSVFLGTLAVAATYLLGRTVAGRTVGLLAALFLTVSRFQIIWSQEIRFYALATLLAPLAAWAAIRVWEKGRPIDYALYVLSATAGLYSLYLFFPVPVAINIAWLWVLWRSRDRLKELVRWGAAQVVVLALLGIWLAYALSGFLTNSSATPISVADFLKIYWTVLVMGIPLRVEQYAAYTIPVLLIFLAGLALLIWQSRRNWRMARDITLFLAGLLIPIAVVFYVTIPKAGAYAPPFSPRYLVIFTGYFAILLAWGIMRLGARKRWPIALLLVMVVLFASWSGLRSYHQGRVLLDDFKSLTATLKAHVQPEDAVVLYSDRDWPIFDYHYPDEWYGVPNNWTVTPEVAESYLRPIWEQHDGIWLVTTQYAVETDPNSDIPQWLEEQATAVSEAYYGDKALHFFARTPQRAQSMDELSANARPQVPLDIQAGLGIRLVGYDLPSRIVHGGDTVHIGTYWRVNGEPGDEGLSEEGGLQLHLQDGDGGTLPWSTTSIALETAASAGRLFRAETAVQIPFDVPSGMYALAISGENGQTDTFARLEIRQRNRPFVSLEEVTITSPLDTEFANGIRLLGYDLGSETLGPGEELDLTLYWQTSARLPRDYKVFTHVLGDVYHAETENFIWAQQDNEPVNNKRPTSTWRADEVIVDPYELTLPPNTPAGVYTVEIGLYDPISGERLQVIDGLGSPIADHVILADVTVP